MRTAIAPVPFVKPLEAFDFDYQPSIDRKQLQGLGPAATSSSMAATSSRSDRWVWARRT